MPQWILSVKDVPRRNPFPFQVEQIYYCNGMLVPSLKKRWNSFEVCIRLYSDSGFTEDIVDGEALRLPCPNVLWRLPGTTWETRPKTCNVISFSFSPSVLETMRMLGMKVPTPGKSFAMSSELKHLISNFNKTVHNLYSPGNSDFLDWICFSLMGTLLLQNNALKENQTLENRIRNLSIWFQTHFSESMNLDEIAASHGMSRACFFRAWKKIFDMTPAQYIIDLRLKNAALSLRETTLPIEEIVREVHFAGEYMFYKRFQQKYGMTPGEYRRRHAANAPEP